MTPFLIWLNRSEIDELIALLIDEKQDCISKREVFSKDELVDFAESLLHQNNSLIEIVKKIDPLSPNSPKEILGTKRKMNCDKIRNHLNESMTQCLSFNSKGLNAEQAEHLLSCSTCTIHSSCN